MLGNTILFIVGTLGDLFAAALLLRFYLQLLRAPYRNPLSQFLAALTDFIVRPARKVIPGLWGMDLSTLALGWFTELLLQLLVFWLKGYDLGASVGVTLVALALLALLQVIKISLYLLMGAVFAQAILSWVNPHSPAAPMLNSLTRPFLRPFQKLIPAIGNVDLSPLFLLLAIQVVLMLPVAWLEAQIAHLF
jgi:YggT family protein